MSHSRLRLIVMAVLVTAISALAQVTAASTNNLPNPYRAVENWATLPPNIQWAQVISVFNFRLQPSS